MMGDAFNRALRSLPGAALGLALGFVVAIGSAAALDVKPAKPQPGGSALKPGLSVVYYPTYVRLIEELEDWMEENPGQPGKPLKGLNYKTGDKGALTSGIPMGVGAAISGFIKFDQAGSYSLVVNSNDGFTLDIGGRHILEDPGVHPDQYSGIAHLDIKEPGWYALQMLYFQRKGTSTLQMFWTPPGGDKMVIVPDSAFGYL
jgi:hypothetical protein